jgi:ATP-dependent protease ClpP protease subunit
VILLKNNNKVNQYIELMESVPEFVDYTYWEFLQDRKIVLNTAIDIDCIEKVVLQILKFNEEDKNIPVSKRKPIQLLIHSGGGDVITAMNVIDVIKTSKTPVHGIALGLVGSAAGIIYISTHKRFAYPNSTILIHDGSLMLSSTAKKAKQTMEYYDKLDERIKNIILENTKIPGELYDQKADEEWYILSQPEGVELGIVDEIIS